MLSIRMALIGLTLTASALPSFASEPTGARSMTTTVATTEAVTRGDTIAAGDEQSGSLASHDLMRLGGPLPDPADIDKESTPGSVHVRHASPLAPGAVSRTVKEPRAAHSRHPVIIGIQY